MARYFLFWVEDYELHHWAVEAENDSTDLYGWIQGKKEEDFLFTNLDMDVVMFGGDAGCDIHIQTNGKDFIVWNGEPWTAEEVADKKRLFSWGTARYVDGETLEAYNLFKKEADLLGFDREINEEGDKVFEPVDLSEYETVFIPY